MLATMYEQERLDLFGQNLIRRHPSMTEIGINLSVVMQNDVRTKGCYALGNKDTA